MREVVHGVRVFIPKGRSGPSALDGEEEARGSPRQLPAKSMPNRLAKAPRMMVVTKKKPAKRVFLFILIAYCATALSTPASAAMMT